MPPPTSAHTISLLLLLASLALSSATPHPAPPPPRPSHFEERMRSILQLPDHIDLGPHIERVALEAQRRAEEVAASGEGTSHYLEWRLGKGRYNSSGSGIRGRSLEVLNGSSGIAAIQGPGLNSAPSVGDINMTVVRYGSVVYPAVTDWRTISTVNTSIFDQKACESCWVAAVTDVVAMLWSLLNDFMTPVMLSPQHVCDCGFPKCCSGGWPEWTLTFARLNKGIAPLSLYPYLGIDSQRCKNTNTSTFSGKITGWEKLPASSPDALIKTIAQHPAVVLLYASPSFLRYSGGIFMGADCDKKKSVNHALVVMGYNATGPNPYWIAKNSWGTGWGEGGFIRISMKGRVCGFGSEPSIYPTMFQVKTPCDVKGGPCGSGTCYMMADRVTARCLCPAGYVEKIEDNAPKCAWATPCTTSVNPCAFGTCNNEFDGSYTCTCPPGSVIGSNTNGGETCIVNSFQSGLETYTSLPGDDCQILNYLFNLTSASLNSMNPFLNCSASIDPGTIVVVRGAESGLGCSSTDAVMPNDTCSTVSQRNGISVAQLAAFNKNSICNSSSNSSLRLSQHVCVQPGDLQASSPYERSCGQSVSIDDNSTCLDLSSSFNVSLVVLEWLNPGIDCSQPLPPVAVCIAPLLLMMASVTCTQYYNVTQGDTCFTVAAGAGLDMADFLAINPGLQCADPGWNVGRTVCINGSAVPLSAIDAAPNMLPYYVQTNDTLNSIAQRYAWQCDNRGLGGNGTSIQEMIADICWANSWMPDCSDRRVTLGSMVLVPCVKNIGGTSYSCDVNAALDPTYVNVCGNNGITFASYSCASIVFATPPVDYNPCKVCQQYCIGISGLSLSAFYGCNPPGCSGGLVCGYPNAPSATDASQLCPATSTMTSVCQVRQVQCSVTTNALNLVASPSSSSVGCQNFRACMAAASCSTYSKSPCRIPDTRPAACGFL